MESPIYSYTFSLLPSLQALEGKRERIPPNYVPKKCPPHNEAGALAQWGFAFYTLYVADPPKFDPRHPIWHHQE